MMVFAETFRPEKPVAANIFRSPFRYPGGKTWLVPRVREWTLKSQPTVFVEMFAGGASVGLAAAFEHWAPKVVLIELDPDVAAFWKIALGPQAKDLADKILSFDLTPETVAATLLKKPRKELERAFAVLLRNRTTFGGILCPGSGFLKKGENGKGLKSRWYAEGLANRIADIRGVSDRIELRHGDGMKIVAEEFSSDPQAIIFSDPPYNTAGPRLYRHSVLVHDTLFEVLGRVQGRFLITCEDTEDARTRADRFCFSWESVPMRSNNHNKAKTELLVERKP